MTPTVNPTTGGVPAHELNRAGTVAARQTATEMAAGGRMLRMAWLWFGPLAVVEALRFWLGTRVAGLPNIEPIGRAPYVETFAGHDAAALHALMWKASQPLLMTVAALAVLILIVWRVARRWGWRRTGVAAGGLWCVICAGMAIGLVANYVNRVDLKPLPPVTATVIAAQPYPGSESSAGGALTWLQPPSAAGQDSTPWRVRIEGADFQAMPAGIHITLQRARGALWGLYLTGSDAPLARLLSNAAPRSAPNRARQPPADPS